ncbi:MAG TPA: amino acid racemase [archaeon]|nr:amino acid racemase [archaeon]
MKLGVIGGFGPETTAEFYMSIVNKNRTLGRSHPDIIIHSVPVPFELEKSAVMDGKNLDQFLPLLLESTRLLDEICDMLVLPCNTLHIFIDDLRKASKKPMLSILEETSKEIERRNIKTVGLLATTKTAESGILESKLNNVTVIKPTAQCQSRLSELIHFILQGKASSDMKNEIICMIEELEDRGAQGVILGCTDLQLIIKQTDVGIPLIDTMETLANSVVVCLGGKYG